MISKEENTSLFQLVGNPGGREPVTCKASLHELQSWTWRNLTHQTSIPENWSKLWVGGGKGEFHNKKGNTGAHG